MRSIFNFFVSIYVIWFFFIVFYVCLTLMTLKYGFIFNVDIWDDKIMYLFYGIMLYTNILWVLYLNINFILDKLIRFNNIVFLTQLFFFIIWMMFILSLVDWWLSVFFWSYVLLSLIFITDYRYTSIITIDLLMSIPLFIMMWKEDVANLISIYSCYFIYLTIFLFYYRELIEKYFKKEQPIQNSDATYTRKKRRNSKLLNNSI